MMGPLGAVSGDSALREKGTERKGDGGNNY